MMFFSGFIPLLGFDLSWEYTVLLQYIQHAPFRLLIEEEEDEERGARRPAGVSAAIWEEIPLFRCRKHIALRVLWR